MTRVVLLAMFVLGGATASASAQAADELKKLQGQWQAVEVESQGKKLGKDHADVKNFRFVFDEKGNMQAIHGGGGQGRKKTFKLDPTKLPKHIDITSLDGQKKDQTAAGIYKLDGDRLILCIPYSVKDTSIRPREFKAGADDGIMLITLERAKAK